MNRDGDYSEIRNDYGYRALDEKDISDNPVTQFTLWLSEAVKGNLPEPSAMVLSTVGDDLKPSSRVVLLKFIQDNQFIFFTNYNSKKGQQLAINPHGSLLFFWEKFHRQVRIEGKVHKVDNILSDNYFNERPEESKISAVISEQSSEIPNRKYLEEARKCILSGKKHLTRPDHWGGYALVPEKMEFWQGRPGRLHDRLEFSLNKGKWKHRRLAP